MRRRSPRRKESEEAGLLSVLGIPRCARVRMALSPFRNVSSLSLSLSPSPSPCPRPTDSYTQKGAGHRWTFLTGSIFSSSVADYIHVTDKRISRHRRWLSTLHGRFDGDRRGACMLDLTGTCLDPITNMIFFATKPLSLVQVVLLLGARSVCFVALAWWRLVNLTINFHANLCWQIMVCSVAFWTLPVRILTALERERKLERLLSEMQIQLESLIWENKELEERLQMAVKDRRVIGTMLQDIEEENEKALARIDLLENELQDLKEENMRLNESQGKALWSRKSHDDMPLGTHNGVPSWRSPSCSESGMNPRLHGDPRCAGDKGETTCGTHQLVSSDMMTMDESLERQRVVALHRSLFGAILSLLVGMIIWEAEDPCLPLVAALFTVVGMSLNSVVQFFSTIKNKPASDAVALLSLNWFILGALTYPTLPRVARMLAPQAVNFADQLVCWLGYSTT